MNGKERKGKEGIEIGLGEINHDFIKEERATYRKVRQVKKIENGARGRDGEKGRMERR